MHVALLLSLLLFVQAQSPSLAGAANEFKVNNPDIKKYEFSRSYLNALSYLIKLDERRHKKFTQKIRAQDKVLIKANISNLVVDNADLRIAKNFLTPYLSSPNAMIRKTADSFIAACNEAISVNNLEHDLWDQWAYLKANELGTKGNERVFVKAVDKSSLARKEIEKMIIQASILMTKVLVSEANADEKGHRLAITTVERKKLLVKLDSFGKNVMDWGLKPKQRTLESSIAVVREILEDPVWIAIDEK